MNKSLEILVFALLAAYLFFRLWNILGKRPRSDEGSTYEVSKGEGKETIITMTPRSNVVPLRKEALIAPVQPSIPLVESAQKNYEKLLEKDPGFDGHRFLQGARRAFIMIVKDFASGDKESLKKLLSETVYKQFFRAIEARLKDKQRVESEVREILESSIEKIEFRAEKVYITVKFKSEQMTLTMDEEGKIIDNPARLSSKVVDIWTFSRPLGASTPNWVLSATKTEDER